MYDVSVVLGLKGSLSCLAIGQMEHIKGYLAGNLTGIVEISLILTKGTCLSLLCHTMSTWFPTHGWELEAQEIRHEIESDTFSYWEYEYIACYLKNE